jgi:hypothetical protein
MQWVGGGVQSKIETPYLVTHGIDPQHIGRGVDHHLWPGEALKYLSRMFFIIYQIGIGTKLL